MTTDQRDSWDTEPEDDDSSDGNNLYAENVNPEIPKSLYDTLTWQALRVAIEASDTKEAVLKWMKEWNIKNNPRLNEKELLQKILWALNKWDTKFKR